MKSLLVAMMIGLGLLASLPSPDARATIQSNSLNNTVSDANMCNGHPWIDVRCYGAVGDDSHDDTSAFNSAWSDAVTNGVALHISAGTYKVTSALVFDLAGVASAALTIISENATIDGTSLSTNIPLTIHASGGSSGSPTVVVDFNIRGALIVKGNSNTIVCQLGNTDFSDKFDSSKVDALRCSNASSNAAAAGIKVGYFVNSDLHLEATTAGGGASVAAVNLLQVQNSKISGYASAAGASAPSLLLSGSGTMTGNVITGFGYGTSATGLSITGSGVTLNSFISPNFSGNATPVNATVNAAGNVLIAPTGLAGPLSGGISLIGRGGINRYSAPVAGTYTASGVDDGLILSAANGNGGGGNTLTLSLPNPAVVGAGWTMGLAGTATKTLVANAFSGAFILGNGISSTSIVVGGTASEIIELVSDGTNYRVTFSTPQTAVQNGFANFFPSRWNYPGGPGYSASQADNGGNFSSFGTSGGLTFTLPSTTAIAAGWMVGLSADGQPLTVNANGSSGSAILTQQGTALTSFSAPNVLNFLFFLQFDGTYFRVIASTPNNTSVIFGDLQGSSIELGSPAGGNQGNGSLNLISLYFAGVQALPASIGAGLGFTGGVLSNNARMEIGEQPGALASLPSGAHNFSKWTKASTVLNIIGSAATFTCGTNPVVQMLECSTDASCGSPTVIGSVTITAANQAFAGTITSSGISAGDYVGWKFSAGACSVLDPSIKAQIQAN